MPIVFFSRCKPQQADVVDIAVRWKRIFIGWPAWKEGGTFRRGRLRDALIDPLCSEDDWDAARKTWSPQDRRQFQKNRNFVHKVEQERKKGAIALVPRPSLGIVYAGKVRGPFVLEDDPQWGEEYIEHRRRCELPTNDVLAHLADVAQCWRVDKFVEVQFSAIPAWIRSSLFGRATYGIIKARPEAGLDPYEVLSRLYFDRSLTSATGTREPREVEKRLLSGVGPAVFEYLCVELMQLEHPAQVWSHIGGSGDGGVDGIGCDIRGKTIGLLQCKWRYQGEDLEFFPNGPPHGSIRKVLASLVHPDDLNIPHGVEFWGRSKIISLVLKHAHRLPLAVSLRILPR